MSGIRRHWVVVINDLPPMPPRREVVRWSIFRSVAESEARLWRTSLNRSIAKGLTSVTVEREAS